MRLKFHIHPGKFIYVAKEEVDVITGQWDSFQLLAVKIDEHQNYEIVPKYSSLVTNANQIFNIQPALIYIEMYWENLISIEQHWTSIY